MFAPPRNIAIAGNVARDSLSWNAVRKPTLSELKRECRISYELNAGFSLTPGELLSDVKRRVSVVEGIQLSDLDTTKREYSCGGNCAGGGGGGDGRFIALKGCGIVIAGFYMETLPHYVTVNVSALGQSRTGTASAGKWAIVVTYYVPLIAYNNVSFSYGRNDCPFCYNHNPHSLEEIRVITESTRDGPLSNKHTIYTSYTPSFRD